MPPARQAIVNRRMEALKDMKLNYLRDMLDSYGLDTKGTRSEVLARLMPLEANRIAPVPGYSALYIRRRAYGQASKARARNRERFIREQRISDAIRAEEEPTAEGYRQTRARLAATAATEGETTRTNRAPAPLPAQHWCTSRCTCDMMDPRCDCRVCRMKVRDPETQLVVDMRRRARATVQRGTTGSAAARVPRSSATPATDPTKDSDPGSSATLATLATSATSATLATLATLATSATSATSATPTPGSAPDPVPRVVARSVPSTLTAEEVNRLVLPWM